MNVLLLIPAFLFGVGIGAYIERYRWLRWARREHPDEIDVSLL